VVTKLKSVHSSIVFDNVAPFSRRGRPKIHSWKREQIILHFCVEAESRTERIGPNLLGPEA
jgi:hypothetical protein